jgi:hypothetical protein
MVYLPRTRADVDAETERLRVTAGRAGALKSVGLEPPFAYPRLMKLSWRAAVSA